MKRLKRREFIKQLSLIGLLPFLPKLVKTKKRKLVRYGFAVPPGFPNDDFPIRLSDDYVLVLPRGTEMLRPIVPCFQCNDIPTITIQNKCNPEIVKYLRKLSFPTDKAKREMKKLGIMI